MTSDRQTHIETACPTCGKPVIWNTAAQHRPFCSDRCRLIDLGEWASGSFRIPSRETPDGLDHEHDHDHPGD